jgi:hypothetical protein
MALVVDHREYEQLVPQKLAEIMRGKRIFIARKFTARSAWQEAGFQVRQLGNLGPLEQAEPLEIRAGG